MYSTVHPSCLASREVRSNGGLFQRLASHPSCMVAPLLDEQQMIAQVLATRSRGCPVYRRARISDVRILRDVRVYLHLQNSCIRRGSNYCNNLVCMYGVPCVSKLHHDIMCKWVVAEHRRTMVTSPNNVDIAEQWWHRRTMLTSPNNDDIASHNVMMTHMALHSAWTE